MRGAVALILVAACGGKSVPATAPPAAEVAPQFTWDWSPPCRMPLRIHLQLNSADFVVGATLSVTPLGDNFLVEMPDQRILELNGQDATTPEMVEQLKPYEHLSDMAAPFVVDGEGRFVRVDSARTLDAVADSMGGAPALSKAVRDPAMRSMGDESVAKMWGSWVGNWRGWSEPVTLDEKGLAHLHTDETLDGDGFVALFRSLMKAAGGDPDRIPGTLSGSMRTWTYGVVEPVGLRTHHANVHMRMVVNLDGREVSTVDSLFEVDFDWDHAEGCGR